MTYRKLKITGFLTIPVLFFFSSCEVNDFENDQTFLKDGKFLYKTEQVFCQSDPKSKISEKRFVYDESGNETEELLYSHSEPTFRTTSTYNTQNKKLSDSVFYFSYATWALSSSYEYKYSENKLVEKINYDTGKTYLYKTTFTYSGSHLRYEEIFRREGNEWILNYGYAYKYNRRGELIEKASFHNELRETIYDTIVYTYKNGKLSTEKRILTTGETGYFKEYFYTNEGYLDEVTEDGNTVVKNFYEDNKLMEKHTWYFGIDPGFSLCNGNLIYKYEY